MVLPILIFGLEVVFSSVSEILMLERCQLSYLGLSLAFLSVFPPMQFTYFSVHFQLNFYCSRLTFHFCFACCLSLMVTPLNVFFSAVLTILSMVSNHIVSILNELDFPDVDDLATIFPSNQAWSAFVKSTLYLHFYDLLDSEVHKMPSLAQISVIHPSKMAKIHPILSYTKGDVKLNRLNNFHLRLLLHCSVHNKDTSMFHISDKYDQRSAVCPACRIWKIVSILSPFAQLMFTSERDGAPSCASPQMRFCFSICSVVFGSPAQISNSRYYNF